LMLRSRMTIAFRASLRETLIQDEATYRPVRLAKTIRRIRHASHFAQQRSISRARDVVLSDIR